MKYINFKRYKFSTIVKNCNRLIQDLLKIFKFIDIRRYDFKNLYKYLYNIRKFDYKKIGKYIDITSYNIKRIKRINFLGYKFLFLHLPLAIIFFVFLYLIIPSFYNYDKSNIASIVCKDKNIECLIKGEIDYIAYPTPRIRIKKLIINDTSKEKNILIKADIALIKLSIKNLLAKEKHQFKSIDLKNYKINLNLRKLDKYKKLLKKNTDFMPVNFKKGEIIFTDEKDFVTSISSANFNLKVLKDYFSIKLSSGNFLDNKIYIKLNSKKFDNKAATDFLLKLSGVNLIVKADFISTYKDKNITSGNFLVKKDKNTITSIFEYKDNELIIVKSNLRNPFLDGKLEGKIEFLPYFDFNLDVNLNSINFTKLYNYFLNLDEVKQKNFFNINKKINGKLVLSAAKVYSKNNLVKSFESRINFNNGNILIDQFLLNLGKLGAADMLGEIIIDKKFINFKYESNIFVDNEKKFLSKFGIYSKKALPPNLFISGNFDLKKIRNSFYEISSDEKLNNNDVNFVEKEFNDFMLSDSYENLFNFKKFKEFLKIIMVETN